MYFDYAAVMQGSGAYGNSRFNDLVSLEKDRLRLKSTEQDQKLEKEVVDSEGIREQVETPKE